MLAVAVLTVSGCRADVSADADDLDLEDVTGSAPSEDPSDVATEPEAEPELEVDPFAIPDEIDTEYVSRVVNELYRLEAETYRLAQEDLYPGETLTPKIVDRLRVIFVDERLNRSSLDLQKLVDEGFADRETSLGLPIYEAENLDAVNSDCLVVVGTVDLSKTVRPSEISSIVNGYSYVLLRTNVNEFNSTSWLISDDGLRDDLQADKRPTSCA